MIEKIIINENESSITNYGEKKSRMTIDNDVESSLLKKSCKDSNFEENDRTTNYGNYSKPKILKRVISNSAVSNEMSN